jgi:hypothetical protein
MWGVSMKKTNLDQLRVAWKRYVNLFGDSPHGTKIQLEALLELIPNLKDTQRLKKAYWLD